ncbi:MAG: FAD-dependent oxidoreductase [Candidatus Rokubacteria bacterium]|nr:FAD-dependent oxidoreductase [Candidatus Rokubacteria bacterium]
MANAKGDVLVIGGGVIGVCAAYYLAREGAAVTLVEKDDVCAGSSYGNAGLIVPSHSVPLAAPGVLWQGLKWMLDPTSPFYIRPRLDPDLLGWLWRFRGYCTRGHLARAIPVLRDLGFASLVLYQELAGLDGLHSGFERRGVLAVFRTPGRLEEARHEAALLEAHGIGTKLLDGPAARAMEPSLGDAVVGALSFPNDAHLVPDAFVTGLAREAASLGVRIRRDTEVLAFETAGRRIRAVETTRGRLEAEQVVLAAGAWSPALARTLDLRLPIQPAKGYSVTCQRPPEGPAMPLLLAEARVAVTPMGERLRFAGTLELAGLDLAIDRRRVEAVRRAPGRYLRLGDALPLVEIWRGLRPCTPDGLPMIGRSTRVENLILATGHAMIGISLGPVTGKLVAQLATGAPTLLDLAPLRPERFDR